MLFYFSVGIKKNEGNQFVNQWLRPHFWYIVYGDSRTCDPDPPDQDHYTIGYTLTFLNPDSYGEATDHFGEDQKGICTHVNPHVILFNMAGVYSIICLFPFISCVSV